jgi:hypothetical protein
MKAYTRPRKKEIINWIKAEALDIIPARGSSGGVAQDAAWRRAVESWLRRNYAITASACEKSYPVSLTTTLIK